MDIHADEKHGGQEIDSVSKPSDAPAIKHEHVETSMTREEAPAEMINGVPYWRTKLFIGSFWAIGFGVLACYAGFAMPANTLSLINADIGQYTIQIAPYSIDNAQVQAQTSLGFLSCGL